MYIWNQLSLISFREEGLSEDQKPFKTILICSHGRGLALYDYILDTVALILVSDNFTRFYHRISYVFDVDVYEHDKIKDKL